MKEEYATCFQPGDLVVIQEKYDGSCASLRYDKETGKLVAFSRRKTLDYQNTLNGFYNYVQSLDAEQYKDFENYVVFGEWSGARNAIIYYPESTKKWYVFDIYDVEKEGYLPQDEVKKFAEEHGLTYIHTYYTGPFVSWDHVMSFLGTSVYGDVQEGVVIKNMTNLNSKNDRQPFVVKIVGEQFHEIHKSNHVRKVVDPQELQERQDAMDGVKSVVTLRRIEKELYKMRDDGLLPTEWGEKDMAAVARYLPNRIYQDCLKEEEETVVNIGKYFGKFCSKVTMDYARHIILGNPIETE